MIKVFANLDVALPGFAQAGMTFPPVDRRYNYSGPTQTLSVRFKDSVSKHVRRSKWAIEADPRNLVVPMAASLAHVNVDETLDALNKRVFVTRRIIGATTIPRAPRPPGDVGVPWPSRHPATSPARRPSPSRPS